MLKVLEAEIAAEMDSIEKECARMRIKRQRVRTERDPVLQEALYESISSTMHSIYGGIERVLLRIVRAMDHDVPSGKSWHKDLLQRTALVIPDVRPAIISPGCAKQLGELLGFRHAFRNLYISELSPRKTLELALLTEKTARLLKRELKIFFKTMNG